MHEMSVFLLEMNFPTHKKEKNITSDTKMHFLDKIETKNCQKCSEMLESDSIFNIHKK